MDSIYFEGTVTIPLCALQGNDTEVSPTYSDFIRDIQSQGLSINITPQVRDDIFRELGHIRTLDTNPQILHGYPIACHVRTSLVQKAILELGAQYRCKLRLFCIPRKYPLKLTMNFLLNIISKHTVDYRRCGVLQLPLLRQATMESW